MCMCVQVLGGCSQKPGLAKVTSGGHSRVCKVRLLLHSVTRGTSFSIYPFSPPSIETGTDLFSSRRNFVFLLRVLLTHLGLFRVLHRKDKLTRSPKEGIFREQKLLPWKSVLIESWLEVFSNASLFNMWHYFILQMVTVTLENEHVIY